MKLQNVKQNLKDYAKCVYANKFTLAGFASLGLGSIFLGAHDSLGVKLNAETVYSAYIPSWMLLFATQFGHHTYRSYKRTKEDIAKYGEVGLRYLNLFSLYCDKVGVELAVKEAGLERLLKK